MKISQREARKLRQRIEALEREITLQRRVWNQEYVHGVEIARHAFPHDFVPEAVKVARKLGHAVVCVGDDTDTLRFIALPHPEVKV